MWTNDEFPASFFPGSIYAVFSIIFIKYGCFTYALHNDVCQRCKQKPKKGEREREK